MQNRRFNLYSRLVCLLAVVFLASCGGGGGSGGGISADSVNHSEPNSAAITFELQIQPTDVNERNASLGRLSAEADICQDYWINTIEVIVTWGGNLETERLVTWPCNDHSGMIDNLPADVPLNLSINGIVDGQIQWHAEFNNLVLDPGDTRSLGYITLGYVGGDQQGPQIVATLPPANAQGIDPSAAVSIQIDEPLAVSSIMDEALRLSADGVDVSGTVEYDPGTRTIRFIPDQVLLPETLHHAVLDAVITDIAGNAMESDYTWSFTTQVYGIHISKTGSGNGTVTSDPAGIDCGSQCSAEFSGISTVTLTAVPADDSTFIGWSGGGCSGTGTCTTTITGPVAVSADFAIKTYTITATAGTGGAISPAGTVTVNHSADRTFTISANAGYYLSRLRVDGANVTAASKYTFSNVTGNHTIEAVFAIQTYTITATAGTGGAISPAGTVTVNHSADRTFTITANAGCYLSRLRVDGAIVTPAPTYTFSNVTGNHIIEAYFAYKTYGLNFSPYMDGQDPNMGSQISEQQLRMRMEIVEPHTVWIRTFGSSCGLEKSGAIAHDLGLKAALGAWIGSDYAANDREIDNLIAAAQAGEVDLLIVGSEVLLRGDLSEDELIYYIDRVKQQVPELPLSYADVYGIWLSHPNIIDAVDIVLVNYYPYWEGIGIDSAVAAIHAWHTQVMAAANGKQVIVSETGWPSDGNQIGHAIPSPDNASFYFLNFVLWARANDVDYFYFEAFDERWKAAYEGPQGAHWGIWDKDGMLKPGMERLQWRIY